MGLLRMGMRPPMGGMGPGGPPQMGMMGGRVPQMLPQMRPQMPQGPLQLQNSFSASQPFQGQLGAMQSQTSPGFQPPQFNPPPTLATGMPPEAPAQGRQREAGNPTLHFLDQGSIMHRAGLTPFGLEDLFG